jgi:lysine 2,3-aminomutase
MRRLMHELLKARIRPYYIYQCDPARGISHFRTPIATGINIMEKMRGHTSGYAVPTYVVDAPGGGGKIPVAPNYVISQAKGSFTLRNYAGQMFTYHEPVDEGEVVRVGHQGHGSAQGKQAKKEIKTAEAKTAETKPAAA